MINIEQKNYSVKTLLTAYGCSVESLSNMTVEAIEAQALESLERAGIHLSNALNGFEKIILIAELVKKYPPAGCESYPELCESLDRVISDMDEHIKKMDQITESLNKIQLMFDEIVNAAFLLKPWECKAKLNTRTKCEQGAEE